MSCEKYKMLVSRYLDDELSASETSEFEAHLAVCEECRLELDEVREIDLRVGRALSGHPFDKKLAEKISSALPRSNPSIIRTRITWVGAMAAMVILAVGLVFVLTTGGEDTGRPEKIVYNNSETVLEPVTYGNSKVIMDVDTRIKVLEKNGKTTIRLEKGRIFVKTIRKNGDDFRVLTGEAEIKPIGTEYTVSRNSENGISKTEVKVLDGRVAVTRKGRTIEVSAGEMATVANGYEPDIAWHDRKKSAEWFSEGQKTTESGDSSVKNGPSGGSSASSSASPPENGSSTGSPFGGMDQPIIPDDRK